VLENGILTSVEEDEIKKHWPIEIKPLSSARLYIARFEEYFPCMKYCISHKN